VIRDHDQAALGREPIERLLEEAIELAELVVDGDAQSLKYPRRGVNAAMAGYQTRDQIARRATMARAMRRACGSSP
jgi:hypothetical protein